MSAFDNDVKVGGGTSRSSQHARRQLERKP